MTKEEKFQMRIENEDIESSKYNIVISMFKTRETDTNPFFKNWEKGIFESLLLDKGKVAIWYDEKEKCYVFSKFTFLGSPDFQGRGQDIQAMTENGHAKNFKNWKTNNDVVVVFNNELAEKDAYISRYSKMQNEMWISLKCGLIGTRFNNILNAHDDKTLKELKLAIASQKDGTPLVIQSTFNAMSENTNETIVNTKLSDIKDSDKMQYISAFSTWLDRDFLNKYGMTAQGMDKIAQQNQAEIQNGALSSWAEVKTRLEMRQKAFKEVKEKFRLDIPYDFSDIWQAEYERVMNQAEVKENEQGENESEGSEDNEISEDKTENNTAKSDESTDS